MTSLRNIGPATLKVNISIEFFFMSKDSIERLALGTDDISTINDCTYNDLLLHGKNKAFVYTFFQTVTPSPDAQQVLDYAIKLLNLSFKYRIVFDEMNPCYQINNWDASWYQLKPLLKKYLPNELEAFNKLYSDCEDRLRPLVYKLDFLYT